MGAFPGIAVPRAAPPLCVAAATDDGLAPHGVRLYQAWAAAGKPAEIHVYAQGGHGFGVRAENLPTAGSTASG